MSTTKNIENLIEDAEILIREAKAVLVQADFTGPSRVQQHQIMRNDIGSAIAKLMQARDASEALDYQPSCECV